MSPAGRAAMLADLPAIAALDAACFDNPWSPHAYAQELARSFARVRVIEGAGGLVGSSCAWILDDEAQLLRIATHPAQRRRGHARALLHDLLQHAAAARCQHVWLEVAAGNVPAVGLYTALGFHPMGRRKGYYTHPPDDALLMRRILDPPLPALDP